MSSGLFDLRGMRALVTGGNRGLGRAMGRGLAAHGSELVLAARDEGKLAEAAEEIGGATGKAVATFTLDLNAADGLGAWFERVTGEVGAIDVLVNCAGIHRRHRAEEMPLEAWREVLEVDLTSAFALCQAFCRHHKQTGEPGRIINICSLMCEGARPTTCNYGAAKAGLLMLTKSLAVEWAEYGINVNAIGPGYFVTEMSAPLQQNEKLNEWVLSNIPQKRWGRPEDLVGAVVFLAGRASEYMTGQIMYLDGGWLAGL